MITIQDLSVITFRGKDAGAFLHNQLTNDIKALAPGACTFAALCQPKGRVMALLLVQQVEGGFHVLCHRTLAAELVTYLLRFRFREQLEITVEEELAVVSLDKQDSMNGALMPLPGIALTVVEGATAPPPDALAAENVMARHLALGVVWLDKTTTEQFLPQMLGQDAIGALNFRKGCFPGQEIIARTRYLGKLKRHPWTGRVQEELAAKPMEVVELGTGDQSASGVLVAKARAADGAQQVFIVARRSEAFSVDTLRWEDQSLPADGDWISPPAEPL